MKKPKALRSVIPREMRNYINRLLMPYIQSGRPVASELCDVDERESGTQIIPRAGRKGGGAAVASVSPFEPYVATNDDDDQVIRLRYGTLQKDVSPNSNINIDGLFDDIPMSEIGSDEFFCWLEVDLSGQYQDPPTDGPTALMDYGARWNDDVWPEPIEYSDGSPVKFYVPIFYVTSHATIGPQRGTQIAEGKWLVRMCTNHLILSTVCYSGGNVPYVAVAPSSLFPPGV